MENSDGNSRVYSRGYSRREANILVSLLAAAATGRAQSPAAPNALPSKAVRFDDIPVKQNGKNRSRAGFAGMSHSGCSVELHQTELAPGEAPHPPHHHAHDEVLMVREGTVEVTISGRKTELGPGSIAYVAANEEHGWRNIGATQAHYFVLAIGRA